MKKLLFYFLFIFFVSTCVAMTMNNSTVRQHAVGNKEYSKAANDSVISVLKQFLIWYKQNYNELKAIKYVPQILGKEGDQYRVDFKAVDLYIKMLKSSSCLSDQYLSDLRGYFKICDEKMLLEKQTDGPPEGLEADLILKTHEIKDSLLKIERSNLGFHSVIQKNGIASTCVDIVYSLQIFLKKEGNSWKITGMMPSQGDCK